MRSIVTLVLPLLLLSGGVAAAQSTAKAGYERVLGRERALTARAAKPSASVVRRLVRQYEAVARRYHRTGYADNALWQAGSLAADLCERTNSAADRNTARRLLRQLVASYPSSSLLPKARARLATLDGRRVNAAPRKAPASAASKTVRTAKAAVPAPPRPSVLQPEARIASRDLPALEPPASPRPGTAPRTAAPRAAAAGTASASTVVGGATGSGSARSRRPAERAAPMDNAAATAAPPATRRARPATVRDVRRGILPEVVRVTIELDEEVAYRVGRGPEPSSVVLDLPRAVPAAPIRDLLLSFDSEPVRRIRMDAAAAAEDATRLVLETDGRDRYSVFSLYNPYRIVLDFDRDETVGTTTPPPAASWTTPPGTTLSPAPKSGRVADPGRATRPRGVAPPPPAPPSSRSSAPARSGPAARPQPLEPSDSMAAVLPPPEAPAANSTGSFSIARQLGLGVSRIVIDPGHGGHDPGALGKRLTEAELVLDVALRLEKLLLRHPGMEVVLTRRTDQFVPLEERTAIANRENADLFLSIHANASRNPRARGVETYFLNFASNASAAAVAARENSASGRTMHALPDIVKAIALNNKMDESRDFAALVQASLVKRLRGQDEGVKDLGVKQAPFVVLIGAQMPSVLAEISFVTHQREVQLLRSSAYREKIARALFDSIVGYQRSLKAVGAVASQE